jgi:hypothetical protein
VSLRRTVVLNLGGEGEPLDGDLVVNVNLMYPPLLIRPSFPRRLALGQVVVAASAGVLPVRNTVVDAVVAHHFPIQFGRLVDGPTIVELAAEVARVLRDGGTADFQCSSCDVRQLASAFTGAGLALLEPARPGYPLRLRKAEAS